MNKNLIYLLLFVVLLGIAGWLVSENSGTGTITNKGKEAYAFTIADTASIDKIIIKDKTPNEVILSRSKKGWLVNGDFRARKEAVRTLLETLARMEMRNFIQDKMQQTVIKRMAVYGKEVNIYKNGKLFKILYVGTETPDEMGTYMMLKGSDQPFAVHIPGFNGYLSSRFFSQAHLWRSRDVITIQPKHVREIEMVYPDSIGASFKLTRHSSDKLSVEKLVDGSLIENRNVINTNLFLSAFRNLKYEGAIIPSDKIYAKRDSLLACTAVFKLKITDVQGDVTELSGYHIKAPTESYDPDVALKEFDPDRMYGFINNEQMVLIQYYGLRHVLKGVGYFSNP